MDPASEHKRPENFRGEGRLAGLLLSLFAAINLAVATRTPAVWTDEPPYTDAAANLYFGSGFTSTMWGQDSHAFWCGNVPLYQSILYITFKLFGFGFFQARAVNIFLACGGTALIWAGLRFSRVVPTASGRILCLALMLSGATSTLTFRTIRPDTTMFFVCALVFFCSQLPFRIGYRCLLAGTASALLPFAGIPMLPYIALVTSIGFICLGWAQIRLLASVCLGVASGTGLLVVFYSWFSSFQTFLANVLPLTMLGTHGGSGPKIWQANPASGAERWHMKIFGNQSDPDNLLTCFFGNPASLLDQKTICDYSALLLFILFQAMAVNTWRSARTDVRRRIVLVVLLTIIIPPAMHLAGHYRSMYRWMTYIPLTIAVSWILGLRPEIIGRQPFRWMVFIILGMSLAAGVPARTLNIIPQWSKRSTAPMEHAAAAIVHPDDVVVCSMQAWFAVRPHARQVYCCDLIASGAFAYTIDLPTNRVSLLCLQSKDYTNVTRIVGGRWQKVPVGEPSVAAALEKTRYAMDFYRRTSD